MIHHNRFYTAAAVTILFVFSFSIVSAQQFTIEQILSPQFPVELVSAKKADRIAWIAYEQGKRNIYTAAEPDFKPVRLTSYLEDDGNDLTNIRISDDGNVIVFVRGHTPNRDGWIANPTSNPDGAERAIWAIKSDGGKSWKVVQASNPVLSPDGKRVLFQRNGEIYEVPVEPDGAIMSWFKGESDIEPGTTPLFRAYGSNGSPRWSPDSRQIAFVSNRGDHSFIGIFDLETRKLTYIAPNVDRDSSPVWSPDGKKIAFIRRPGSPFQSSSTGGRGSGRGSQPQFQGRGRGRGTFEPASFRGGYTLTFWIADIETGEAHEFWHNPLEDSEPDPTDPETQPVNAPFRSINSIQWAGENVIFRVERNNWRHYYSVPINGDPDFIPVNLTPGEGIAEHIGLSSDGEYLFYSTNVGDIDRRHIWKTPTAGGAPVQLTRGDRIETYPAVLASGAKVAVLSASARQPHSVAMVSASGGEPEVIVEVPEEFPLDEQVIPEQIILTAEDGLEFHNQLFLPKDLQPGERRPAILFTHGGPGRQMLLGYHYMHFYHMAYAINQYFANQGYVVISVNYRSGIGYGREFRRAENRGSRGNSEYQDVVAAGLYLKSRPDVDPQRIGLWGLSYGGLLTAQGLARNSDIFAAGVDIAGVHLWGNSLDPNSISYQSSAISAVDQWTSPVLLIHGDDDRNVAFSQTTGLIQLLRARGVHYELIVFPDDVHDSLLFNRWLITFNAADDFFSRFVKNK